MKILGIDTSTMAANVAVLEDDKVIIKDIEEFEVQEEQLVA